MSSSGPRRTWGDEPAGYSFSGWTAGSPCGTGSRCAITRPDATRPGDDRPVPAARSRERAPLVFGHVSSNDGSTSPRRAKARFVSAS